MHNMETVLVPKPKGETSSHDALLFCGVCMYVHRLCNAIQCLCM